MKEKVNEKEGWMGDILSVLVFRLRAAQEPSSASSALPR